MQVLGIKNSQRLFTEYSQKRLREDSNSQRDTSTTLSLGKHISNCKNLVEKSDSLLGVHQCLWETDAVWDMWGIGEGIKACTTTSVQESQEVH